MKTLLIVLTCLASSILSGSEAAKHLTLPAEIVAAIAGGVSLLLAAVVRWFEKKVLKNQIEEQKRVNSELLKENHNLKNSA